MHRSSWTRRSIVLLVALAAIVTGTATVTSLDSQRQLSLLQNSASATHPAVRLSEAATGPPGAPTTAPATSPTTQEPATATTSPSTVQTNCAPVPSRCGFPDATNTGVQPGITLQRVPEDITSGPGWIWDSRGWLSVNDNGAILENIVVNNGISVQANNVTIRNIVINTGGEDFGIALRHTNNTRIEHVEIGPTPSDSRLLVGIKDIYGDATGTLITHADIWGSSTGVQMGSGTLTNSYIHDLRKQGDDHVNGFTSNGSTQPLTLTNNTIFNSFDQTDAISLFQDFGVEANRTITNNLIGGGGYTLYGGAGTKGQTSNIVITNNRFTRHLFPNSGYYGPVAAYEPNAPGNIWTGNIWDDTNTPVNQ